MPALLESRRRYHNDTQPDSDYYRAQTVAASRRLLRLVGVADHAEFLKRISDRTWRDMYYFICQEIERTAKISK